VPWELCSPTEGDLGGLTHGIDGPFIDDFPSELNLHLFLGFSMAMSNNQMVNPIKSH
jgi:hypothetical protein